MRSLRPLLAAIFLVTACSNATPTPSDSGSSSGATATASSTTAGLPDRDPQLAKKLVGEGAVLIDVRSQSEWDGGHIDGANLIPVQELPDRLGEVDKLAGGDKDKPVVLYCKSGGRAGRAKDMLLKAGYTRVTNMGGISDWPKD